MITVPAYFDDAQRAGTKDAARLANLNVLRLLNEPTAAAIAYGLDSGQEGVIAVYDLGGGTFDISVLRLSKGVFEVLATGGDSALGGDDFDHLIADWISEQAQFSDLTGDQRGQLNAAATTAKIALSNADSTDIDVLGWQGTLDRETFDSLIGSLVKKTLMSCRRALKDADVSADEVLEVVMVGGSTRVPLVREKVGEFFGQTPLTSIDRTKSWRLALQSRPISWWGTNLTQICCFWMLSRCPWALKPWVVWWRKLFPAIPPSCCPGSGIHHVQRRPDGHESPCIAG